MNLHRASEFDCGPVAMKSPANHPLPLVCTAEKAKVTPSMPHLSLRMRGRERHGCRGNDQRWGQDSEFHPAQWLLTSPQLCDDQGKPGPVQGMAGNASNLQSQDGCNLPSLQRWEGDKNVSKECWETVSSRRDSRYCRCDSLHQTGLSPCHYDGAGTQETRALTEGYPLGSEWVLVMGVPLGSVP